MSRNENVKSESGISSFAPFSLQNLKFLSSELEPFCSSSALRHHREVIHAGYISQLNALEANVPELEGMTIEEILRGIEKVPSAIRDLIRDVGGGHANHQFFWKILAKFESNRRPHGELLKLIDLSFGSFEDFKQKFIAEALNLNGNGWIFLVVDPAAPDQLKIFVGSGNESVLYRGTPGLLICDLWEHSYAQDKNITRQEYLKNFWNVVDWDAVGLRLVGIRNHQAQL